MSVDADTVRRIAHLARIAVAEEEVAHFQGELNAILAFVEHCREVDVAAVAPMTSVMPMRDEDARRRRDRWRIRRCDHRQRAGPRGSFLRRAQGDRVTEVT